MGNGPDPLRRSARTLLVAAAVLGVVITAVLVIGFGQRYSRPNPQATPDPPPSHIPLAAPTATRNSDMGRTRLIPASIPIQFETNAGQIDPQFRFLARGKGYRAYFGHGEVTYAMPSVPDPPEASDAPGLHADSSRGASPRVVRVQFADPAHPPEVVGGPLLPGVVNYFTGRDPAGWRTNVPTHASVLFRGVAPGVDLEFHADGAALASTYRVAPGADPAAIRWTIRGADSVRIDGSTGELVQDIGGSALRSSPPRAFQTNGAEVIEIPCAYLLAPDGSIRFRLAPHRPDLPIWIR